jgi:hypothetical protein
MRNLMSSEPTSLSGGQDILVAFLLTLFLTGIFAFPGFAYATSRLLPDRYYRLKNPKYLKQIYSLLGVKYFKVVLLFVFWGAKKNKQKYFDGTRRGFKNLIYQSKQSEFGHLGALLAILVATCFLLFERYFMLAAIVMLINVVGNLYPIVLQRHHRLRVERLMS